MEVPTIMQVIELIAEMRTVCQKLREDGHWISFVPTMGALHIGHASLIKSAGRQDTDETEELPLDHGQVQVASKQRHFNAKQPQASGGLLNSSTASKATSRKNIVVVSIFVNQKQFSNPNDFAKYPNTLDSDLELCRRLGVDYVFVPRASEVYPPNRATCTVLAPPSIANDLEGSSRPGHFAGMLTVVCKLFNIIRPHEAHFGEKDYQQLVLVSKMSQDLNLGVQVVAGKTVRDPDMLPLSSRNVHLSFDQRKVAPVMYKILTDAKEAIESSLSNSTGWTKFNGINGDLNSTLLASMMTTLYLNLDNESLQNVDVDYLELRCSKDVSKLTFNEDLKAFDCLEGCAKRKFKECGEKTLVARLLTSVIVGDVRLLDNIEVVLNGESDAA